MIPAEVRARPTPTREAAHRALLMLAARSYGVATVTDLAGYHMLKPRDAKPRVDELVEDGSLVAVAVEGWTEPAYVVAGTNVPRGSRSHATLVSPFDSLVWDRKRTQRVFGFDYRIEVYVPPPRRVHGYYVLPRAAGRPTRRPGRPQSGSSVVDAARRRPRSPSRTPRTADVAVATAVELDAMRAWLQLDTRARRARAATSRDPLAASVAATRG